MHVPIGKKFIPTIFYPNACSARFLATAVPNASASSSKQLFILQHSKTSAFNPLHTQITRSHRSTLSPTSPRLTTCRPQVSSSSTHRRNSAACPTSGPAVLSELCKVPMHLTPLKPTSSAAVKVVGRPSSSFQEVSRRRPIILYG